MLGTAPLVGRLTLRTAGADTPALRLALARHLESAELTPGGMPPREILILRRLEGRLPAGRSPRSLGDDRLGAGVSAGYAAAVRPHQGRLPPDAPAVLFADSAELLACLALDLAAGVQRRRWWWTAVLERLEPLARTRPAALLASRPRDLPAVVHLLDQWGYIETVLAGLTGDEAVVLAELVAATVGPVPSSGPGPGAAPSPLQRAPADPAVDAGAAGLLAAEDSTPAAGSAGTAPAPAVAVPEPSRLGPEARRLLTLCRAGAQPRTAPDLPDPGAADADPPAVPAVGSPPAPSSIAVADGWRRPAAPAPTAHDAAPAGRRRPTPNPDAGSQAAGPGAPADAAQAGSDAAAGVAATPRPPPAAALGGDGQGVLAAPRLASAGASARSRIKSPVEPAAVSPTPAARAIAAITPPATAWESGVPTDWGGVLYLIHLLQAFDLPHGHPADLGSPTGLGFWGLLELLGRTLVQDGAAQSDPIWDLLAGLDGRRSGELPHADLPAAAGFRLPAAWQADLLDGTLPSLRWTPGGRLIAWSGALLILEAPDPGSDGARRAALAPWGGAVPAPGARPPPLPTLPRTLDGLTPGLAGWLRRLLPALTRRLAGALGLDDRGGDGLRDELLACRGTLYLTRTHLDLVAGLDQISLAARRAGLDRDPGWLPAFGKAVAFHYR